jgi:hypothetical protein
MPCPLLHISTESQDLGNNASNLTGAPRYSVQLPFKLQQYIRSDLNLRLHLSQISVQNLPAICIRLQNSRYCFM